MRDVVKTSNTDKNVILMILNQNFPDVRVCQEVDVLKKSGYITYIVVPAQKESSSPEYLIEGYNLIELDLNQNKIDKLMSLVTNNYPKIIEELFNNPAFCQISKSVFAVHVHDLHWCKFGLKISQYLNAKLIVDFHENYPALIEFASADRPSLFDFKSRLINYFRSYKKLVSYENEILKIADKVIVVVNENATRLIEQYAIDQSKIHVVSNTKDPEDYLCYGLNEKQIVNVFYHGSIQKLRGLRTLIDSFIESNNPNLSLTIIGFKPGCKEKEYILSRLSNNLSLSVELIDWSLDRDLILNKIKKADLCVIPHEYSELGQTTVPNKIFEYMCHGKALLVSDLQPLKRVVDEVNCGFVFKAGSVESLTSILKSLNNKDQLTEFAKNARYAAEHKYSWRNDAVELVRLYGDLK